MAEQQSTDKPTIWKKRFENRQQKMARLFDDAQKYYDVMYAVQNTTKISPWKSKVYVPILASKAWDLIARMSDVVPRFDVTIKNELELNDETGSFQVPEVTDQRRKRIEAKLQHDYLCGHEEPMKLKVFDPLVDAVVAGTGYAYAPWIFEEETKYGRPFDATGNMDNENVVTKKTNKGNNGFEGVNFYNVFPADAPSFFRAPYLIIRGFKTKVDMKASGLYDEARLELCDTDGRQDQYELYNNSRNRIVNEQEQIFRDESVDVITYFECYERTEKGVELTTYALGAKNSAGENSGWIEIRPTSIPYWHNMFPIVPFYCRKKSYSVFGESLFENNRTLQSATNDIFNHYIDNLNLSLDSMLMYEDGTLTNDFIVEPGGEITFTGEAPKQFKFPEPNPQQLSLVTNVLEKGIDNATFSPYAAGSPNDKNDKTQGTAYGVKSITEAATTKIGFFRDNFKQSMKILGRIWLSNLQQFADDPSEIRRVESGRTIPDVVLPSDYQGELELDIDDDSMVPLSKADRRDMGAQFTQELIMMQDQAVKQYEIFKDPTDIPRYNFHELGEERAELYSVKDFDRFLLDSSQQIPQPPEKDDTKEFLNLSYKDAPPDIKAQIEEKYGLQPSTMHDSDLAHSAIKQGVEQAQLEQSAMQNNPDLPGGGVIDGQGRPGANQAPATA